MFKFEAHYTGFSVYVETIFMSSEWKSACSFRFPFAEEKKTGVAIFPELHFLFAEFQKCGYMDKETWR
jgi:hypothetical protein